MEVVRLPVLSDNYVWLLHEPSSNQTAVVDPAVHEPVLQALKERWVHSSSMVHASVWQPQVLLQVLLAEFRESHSMLLQLCS